MFCMLRIKTPLEHDKFSILTLAPPIPFDVKFYYNGQTWNLICVNMFSNKLHSIFISTRFEALKCVFRLQVISVLKWNRMISVKFNHIFATQVEYYVADCEYYAKQCSSTFHFYSEKPENARKTQAEKTPISRTHAFFPLNWMLKGVFRIQFKLNFLL